MEQVAIALQNYITWDAYLRTGHSNDTCSRSIRYGQTDTLMAGDMGRCSRGQPLAGQLAAVRPGVVIVSAGPHVYGESNWWKVLRHLRDQLAPQHPTIRFIWRTQYPAGCGDELPLTTLPTNRSRFWAAPPDAEPPTTQSRDVYNHRSFHARDVQAKRFFAQRQQLVDFFDMTPLHYRADAHLSSPGAYGKQKGAGKARKAPDCLHLCWGLDGGPLGLVPQMLLHQIETGQLRF